MRVVPRQMLCGMRQISVTECLVLRCTSRHREHLAGHGVTQGEGRLAKAGKKPMRVVCVCVCVGVCICGMSALELACLFERSLFCLGFRGSPALWLAISAQASGT